MPSSCGVLALYTDEETLKKACASVRTKYKDFDAFTPFPVHGIEEAMGLKRSPIPWVTFVAGLTGATLGSLLQYWTSAVDWALNVGGKPFNSGPAFVPVVFELTVLLGGLATAGALFYFCKLPDLSRKSLDPSLTTDKFGIFVPSNVSSYNEQEVLSTLRGTGAFDVKAVGA